jgi:hypothetical protein
MQAPPMNIPRRPTPRGGRRRGPSWRSSRGPRSQGIGSLMSGGGAGSTRSTDPGLIAANPGMPSGGSYGGIIIGPDGTVRETRNTGRTSPRGAMSPNEQRAMANRAAAAQNPGRGPGPRGFQSQYGSLGGSEMGRLHREFQKHGRNLPAAHKPGSGGLLPAEGYRPPPNFGQSSNPAAANRNRARPEDFQPGGSLHRRKVRRGPPMMQAGGVPPEMGPPPDGRRRRRTRRGD